MRARGAVGFPSLLAVLALVPVTGSAALLRAPTALLERAPSDPLVAASRPESASVEASHAPVPAAGATVSPRSVSAAASFTGGAGQLGVRTTYAGRLDGTLRAQLAPWMAAELGTALLTRDHVAAFERRASRTEARLAVGAGARSAWLGVAFEQDLSGGIPDRGPLLTLGASSQAGVVRLGAALTQTVDRVVLEREGRATVGGKPISLPTDTSWTFTETHIGTATSALLTGRWEHRRVSLETVGGVTLNRLVTPRWWSQTAASVALAPRVSLFATAGSPGPRWLALNGGSEARATLGLRLTTQANPALEPDPGRPRLPAWRLRPLGGLEAQGGRAIDAEYARSNWRRHHGVDFLQGCDRRSAGNRAGHSRRAR